MPSMDVGLLSGYTHDTGVLLGDDYSAEGTSVRGLVSMPHSVVRDLVTFKDHEVCENLAKPSQ